MKCEGVLLPQSSGAGGDFHDREEVSMPRKIAMIGAGSVVFCKTLMSDIMATPALVDSEFALMSPTEEKLRRMEAFGQRMIKDNGLPGCVWATTDGEEAIKDADFGVVMIQVGGS